MSTPFLNFSRIICTNFRQDHASGFWGAGLCGWNCRHTFFSIFPELGPAPAWTQADLEALNARNIEYNGKKYTRYEINQMQRARERNVRRWKKRYLAETAAGVDPTDSAVKLRQARQELAGFITATGGRADSARTSVPKFGRSEAGKANYTARKQERFDAANKELQQLRDNGTIKSTGKLIESPSAPNELIVNRDHVFQRMIERKMTLADCDKIISASKVALSQWNGGQIVYYSEQGFVAVRSNGVISTLGPLDDGGKKLMEVVEKHGIPH